MIKVQLKSTRKDPIWFSADRLKVGEVAVDESGAVCQLIQSSDNNLKTYLAWITTGICSPHTSAYTVRYLRDDESVVITDK